VYGRAFYIFERMHIVAAFWRNKRN